MRTFSDARTLGSGLETMSSHVKSKCTEEMGLNGSTEQHCYKSDYNIITRCDHNSVSAVSGGCSQMFRG